MAFIRSLGAITTTVHADGCVETYDSERKMYSGACPSTTPGGPSNVPGEPPWEPNWPLYGAIAAVGIYLLWGRE